MKKILGYALFFALLFPLMAMGQQGFPIREGQDCGGTTGNLAGIHPNCSAPDTIIQDATAFAATDGTQDVATSGKHIFKTVDTTTLTDFVDTDGNHSEFTADRLIRVVFLHAATLDCTGGQLTCNAGIDWLAAVGDYADCVFSPDADGDGQWLCDVSRPTALPPVQIGTITNPAATGAIGLANGATICWRNAANTADICRSTGMGVVTKSTATTYTIGTTDAAEAFGGVIYVTGAATITAPAVLPGMSFTVKVNAAVPVSLDVNIADRMILDGTPLADGDKATNTSTAGDMIVCTYESAAGFDCSSGSNDGDLWTDTN